MAQKKYTDGSGVSEIWLNIKNYIASQLLGYSQTGHTHTKSQITDLDLNNYLPLRGGTLSGSIAFSGTCYTSVGTGKELSSDRYVVTTTRGNNLGGSLYLYGGDFENSWGEKGNFRLVAQSKEKGSKYLLGTPSGSLTWNGKELATQEYVNTNYSQTGHTHSASDITSGLATVATSGSYNDLSNKPTIPKVNNATLTIQKNGTTVKTFTANASSNVTANITVPTKVSQLTNDSGYITGVAWGSVTGKPSFATVATSGSYNDLTDLPTIPSPYTPPIFAYDSSTETLTVSNTTATVFNYDSTTETLEIQING